MRIEALKKEHAEDAARLVLEGYGEERRAVGALPPYDGCPAAPAAEIAGLAGGSAGLPAFAATGGGRLLGFLAGYPVDDFFGSHKGVYVPVTGHAAAGEDRKLVVQRLYEAASGAWVGEGRLTHCLSAFAHDAETVDAWYWLGFGLRCVDAVRPLSPVQADRAAPFEVRKAAPGDAEALYPLHREHRRYYRNPPLFMPRVDLEDGPDAFRSWLADGNHHLWAAYEGGAPVSYLRIQRGGGNTFVTRGPEAFHITGAFTAESARRAGAGALLLASAVEWLRENGAGRLSVDFESFNVFGSRFWMKHFTPFLFSPVRVIDDRIIL